MTPIDLSNDTLTVRLLPQGAALAGLWMAPHPHSLVLGFSDVADISRLHSYMGALVGPVANRIGGAAITLGGTRYDMEANEGPNSLHSGSDGLHLRMWQVSAQSHDRVAFTCTLPHMACGLPGNREITAEYRLQENTLTLEITATTDRDTALNIAHHPYWNLAGAGTLHNHDLNVDADTYLVLDGAGLPTGATSDVSTLGLRPRQNAPLTAAKALDHNLCLSHAKADTPRFAATLTGPNGISLRIETTEPGLQVYDGAGLPDVPDVPCLGAQLGPHAGIALEPQGWPDAPNRPEFPQITLSKGGIFRQITRYSLSQSR